MATGGIRGLATYNSLVLRNDLLIKGKTYYFRMPSGTPNYSYILVYTYYSKGRSGGKHRTGYYKYSVEISRLYEKFEIEGNLS